ncbi:MAG: tetratricopeptide repeat protein [Desulfobacteraceae bacterium]|nr:tetratricopeptide repeat protein [Desulfobacteraceae bacterium]MDH3838426.1 tetratricopeptide repeat protein [Desulfobacteraceae bacterium]
MTTQGFKRKLTAILSADVKGYSRLMGEDDEATVRTITAYRKVIAEVVQKYRGRVVDSPGDNILAEFASVIDAVSSSVEIQEELRIRNAELPEDRKMEFRIGVNLGDVIHEEDRIYGDGVNVAARVESLADPGGICVSGTVFDQVESKLPLGYEFLGEQSVKNIPKPVRIYKALMDPEAVGKVIGEQRVEPRRGQRVALVVVTLLLLIVGGLLIWRTAFPPVQIASVEKMAFPLPDKPSIAVLPFDNMSDDPKQEYFSDGLTEQIISSLSKIPYLFVIARNSTFTYKGKAVKVQKVAEDLGVKYVLEGSVQKTPDRVRITAQLVDTITGHHLWSERYDRELEDIFAIQDDITMEIMKAMQVKLTRGEQARLWGKHETTNLEAYEKSQEGRAYILRYSKENNALGRQLLEEAIALDSGFAVAYAFLGWTHFFDARFGWTESRSKSAKMAFEYAQKSLEMDDTLDLARTLLSAVYLVKRQHDEAVVEAERAVALNPGTAHSLGTLAGVLGCSGRWEDSIIYFKKAIRVDPIPPITYLTWLGRAYFMTGQYDESIPTFKKALDRNPNYLPAHAFLAASYISLDKEPEAVAAAEEVLRINPKFSLESYAKTLPYKNKADIDRYVSALRKAGLPESLPLELPDKPSIAVLPFVNMSGDPEQEYFSDGLTEEIITALSKVQRLFVIARNSTFTYKGKPVKVQKVNRELGVRYVLEGSVRKSGDQVRITAQLIDATTGNHLWAERYDRELKDIFVVQDEITKNIIMAMQVKLTDGEQARAAAKGTTNLEAYLKYLQARDYALKLNPESNALGKQLAEEAISLDPEYASAYRLIGGAHMSDLFLGTSKSPKDSIAKAIALTKKAIALDETYAEAYGQLGFLYSITGQYDKGIAEAEKAVAINPNSAQSHYRVGKTLSYAGRWEESIPAYKKAIRLNPIPPNMYLWSLGLSYCYIGQYEEAITWSEKAIRQEPDSLLANRSMTAIYSMSGMEEEARAQAAEVIRIQPKFSLEKWAKRITYKNQEDKERLISALRKAGLK